MCAAMLKASQGPSAEFLALAPNLMRISQSIESLVPVRAGAVCPHRARRGGELRHHQHPIHTTRPLARRRPPRTDCVRVRTPMGALCPNRRQCVAHGTERSLLGSGWQVRAEKAKRAGHVKTYSAGAMRAYADSWSASLRAAASVPQLVLALL